MRIQQSDHSVRQQTSVMSFSLPVSCTALRILAMAHLLFTMSSCRVRLLAYSLPFSISRAFSFLRQVSTSFLNFSSWIFIQMSDVSLPCDLLVYNFQMASFRDDISFLREETSLLRQLSLSFFISVIFLSNYSFFQSCFYMVSAFFLQSTVLSSLMSLRVAILKFLLSSFISSILFCSYFIYCSYSSLLLASFIQVFLTLLCNYRFSLSSAYILVFRSLMISSLLLRDCSSTSNYLEDYAFCLSIWAIFSFNDLDSCQLPLAMCLVLY